MIGLAVSLALLIAALCYREYVRFEVKRKISRIEAEGKQLNHKFGSEIGAELAVEVTRPLRRSLGRGYEKISSDGD